MDLVFDIISGLSVGSQARVGLLTYASDVSVIFQLSTFAHTIDALNAASIFYTGGSTNTAAAIETADNIMFTAQNGDRRGVRNVLVLLTDGQSTDPSATVQAAMNARSRTENPIQIITVGIGASANEAELKSIASSPVDSNYFKESSFDDLSAAFSSLNLALCQGELHS